VEWTEFHSILLNLQFPKKVIQAKDIQEHIRMLTKFVQSQVKVLIEQVNKWGETATKTAMDSEKTPTNGGPIVLIGR